MLNSNKRSETSVKILFILDVLNDISNIYIFWKDPLDIYACIKCIFYAFKLLRRFLVGKDHDLCSALLMYSAILITKDICLMTIIFYIRKAVEYSIN